MTTSVNQASFAEIMARLDQLPPSARFTYPIRHGSMRAGLYAPREFDDQTPHDQDELYIVARGSGTFALADEQLPFAAGDMLFVRAGEPHRFFDFTADFATWVIFWGPQGGEGEAGPIG